jgi:ADP-ribosylglycohydrolase
MSDHEIADKLTGYLLGGTVGDALGWPLEFLSKSEIRRKFGPDGIRDFVETAGGVGVITDDTQMTLFIGEGLLREYQDVANSGLNRITPQPCIGRICAGLTLRVKRHVTRAFPTAWTESC